MSMKYPRMPTGPSAVGRAGVRALQETGGDWQRKHTDINTTSFQQGDFKKVLVEGDPLYVAAGLTSPTKVGIRDVGRIQLPATPSIWRAFGVSMDDGDFARWVREPFSDVSQSFLYTTPDPDQTLQTTRRTTGISLVLAGIKKPARIVAETVSQQEFYEPTIPASLVEPELAYLGGGKVFSVIPQFLGRVDGVNRPLIDLALFVASRKDGAAARVLPLPAGSFGAPTEVMPRVIPFVTEDAAFALMLQKQSTPPAAGSIPDGHFITNPMMKAWLYVFADHDMTANAMTEITGGGIISDFTAVTTADPGGVTIIESVVGLFMDRAYSAAGRTLDGMLTLVLPGNVVLVFCETFHATAWVHPDSSLQPYSTYLQRLNVTRITYAAGSASAAHVYESKFSLVIEQDNPVVFAGLLAVHPEGINNGTGFPRVQSAVYLGQGVVLAKRSSGHAALYGSDHWVPAIDIDPAAFEKLLDDSDHDITFIRSTDSGATWAEITPTGFDNTGKNQYFGDLVTHKAATVDDMGSVLISAWDNTKQAYYVYESKDQGSTWVRRGKLAKPDEFRRVDSWRPGDGGGHFGELRPVGTKTRPVDVSIPTRYKRD